MDIYKRILRALSRSRPDDDPENPGQGMSRRLFSALWVAATIASYSLGLVTDDCSCMQSEGRDTMCTGPHDFIPATAVAQVELIYNLDGQIIENRVFLRGSEQWTLASLAEIGPAAVDSWTTNLAPLLSDQLQLVLIRSTDMEVQDGAGVEYEPPTIPTGVETGGSFPNNVTLTTKFSSGLTGRTHRGRVYTPGIPRSAVTTSAVNEVTEVLAGDFSSSWGNFFDDFIAAVGNATNHVIVSYCFNKTWRTVAELTNVIGYSTNVTLDSQRRRLPERGQ